MAIIFGWGGGRPKDEGPVLPIECPNCHNQAFFRLVNSRKWFRLYFIPIVPYSSKHFLICPVCTAGKQLTGNDIRRAREMVTLTNAFKAGHLTEETYAEALSAFSEGKALPAARPALGAGAVVSTPPPPPPSVGPATPPPPWQS
jgi:hypothetical protein